MAKVLQDFRDAETWAAYKAGDEYDGTPERVAELAAKGVLDAPKPAPKRRAAKPKE